MRALQASRTTPDVARSLEDAALDVTGAAVVQVHVRRDGKVLWVNVNGVCVLRVCRIQRYEEETL